MGKKIIGICPECGQPALLIRSWEDGEWKYFWDHENSRDLYVHGGNAFRRRKPVEVASDEVYRLNKLSQNGEKSLVKHSDSIVCIQTGEVYRDKWAASDATGIRVSALGNALNNGQQAGGCFWRYAEYSWRDPEELKPKVELPNWHFGPSLMKKMDSVAEPLELLQEGCPKCGSHSLEIDGRTMLPALMLARDVLTAGEITHLTGVDKVSIRNLKKWKEHRSEKDMAAAKAIADEFGVTVEFLLSLDPRDRRIFPEAYPSYVICDECGYEEQWEMWERQEEDFSVEELLEWLESGSQEDC